MRNLEHAGARLPGARAGAERGGAPARKGRDVPGCALPLAGGRACAREAPRRSRLDAQIFARLTSPVCALAGSVNQGLQLHDRAEKRRQADPAAACALYREAIAAYQVPSARAGWRASARAAPRRASGPATADLPCHACRPQRPRCQRARTRWRCASTWAWRTQGWRTWSRRCRRATGEASAPPWRGHLSWPFSVTVFHRYPLAVPDLAPAGSHARRKEQYEEALCAATQQYSEVLQEESTHVEAMNNWGAALHSLAEIRDRAEALAMLQEASTKLEQACSLAPADFEAANNHADALAAWAALLARDEAGNICCGPDSEALWARAYNCYAGSMPSMQYDFDRVNCLCNWSTALSKHAELKQDTGDRQAAYSLFIAAAEKLRESSRLSHSDPDGFVALVRVC